MNKHKAFIINELFERDVFESPQVEQGGDVSCWLVAGLDGRCPLVTMDPSLIGETGPGCYNLTLLTQLYSLLNQTKHAGEVLAGESDKLFLLVMSIIIFFMQCGFAFLEAGSVRSKNTVNILIKNMLDALIGGLSYWAIGWGLAYGAGGNIFCGGSQYFNYQLPYDSYPKWFFQVFSLPHLIQSSRPRVCSSLCSRPPRPRLCPGP